jgi:hypothetical protein
MHAFVLIGKSIRDVKSYSDFYCFGDWHEMVVHNDYTYRRTIGHDLSILPDELWSLKRCRD